MYGTRPSWSPDGTKIVFENYAKGAIYTIGATGGTPAFVTNGRDPDWQSACSGWFCAPRPSR
jgi:Tol biopolymer transport system component